MNDPEDANRGVCPVCGRAITLLRDGRIGRHGSKSRNVWPPEECAGWGQQSREAHQ